MTSHTENIRPLATRTGSKQVARALLGWVLVSNKVNNSTSLGCCGVYVKTIRVKG